MSSSPTSSSSSKEAERPPFADMLNVVCPVSVMLGTGSITVRDCLSLLPQSVLRLDQAAGDDLQIVVNGIVLAKGEVVIVDDTTSLRVAAIVPPLGVEGAP